jgi:rsbT co-antagonist protein RsbR
LRQLARASSAVVETVARSFRGDAPRLIRALRAFSQLKDGLAVRAGEAYARERVAVAQEEQRKVIRELSTPVVEVWQGILVMPLVGVLDSVRARQMMEQLLERIKALGSRVVIVDVTGVPTVDTEVANHFLRTMQAARLVGAATILVGISPAMAQTLVRLEATLPGLETYADLRSGLEAALERLGYRVVSAYPKVGRGGHRHG